jgi:hypothetical protein
MVRGITRTYKLTGLNDYFSNAVFPFTTKKVYIKLIIKHLKGKEIQC